MSEESSLRRRPVYLVLDMSYSMNGPPIVALREAVQLVMEQMEGDTDLKEEGFLCVIKFNSTASVIREYSCVYPVVRVDDQEFKAEGGTSFGAALTLLFNELKQKVRPFDPKRGIKGDYQPVVLFLTDGRASSGDNWDQVAEQLRHGPLKPRIYALAVGPDARVDDLKLLTDADKIYYCMDMDPAKIKEWLSKLTQPGSLRAEGDIQEVDGVERLEEPEKPEVDGQDMLP